MALKALMLKKQIEGKKKDLENLRSKDAEFVTREAELEQAIEEAETEEETKAAETAAETSAEAPEETLPALKPEAPSVKKEEKKAAAVPEAVVADTKAAQTAETAAPETTADPKAASMPPQPVSTQ